MVQSAGMPLHEKAAFAPGTSQGSAEMASCMEMQCEVLRRRVHSTRRLSRRLTEVRERKDVDLAWPREKRAKVHSQHLCTVNSTGHAQSIFLSVPNAEGEGALVTEPHADFSASGATT